MDEAGSSAGRSEPGKIKLSSGSRKDSSSITSGGDQDKHLTTAATNSHIVKHFGPLFEEYRQRKVEMRIELLGPEVHTPFTQLPVMKTKSEPLISATASRKAIDVSSPMLKLGLVELKSNDFANSIIDESQSN